MAEIDIGKHCIFPDCKQLDFLPVCCHWCQGDFCREHSPPDKHCCLKYDEAAVSGEYSGPKSYSCCFVGCRQHELTPIICQACSKNYCLSHRHQADHACEKLEAPVKKMTQTAQHVKTITDSRKTATEKKVPRSKKARATAAKVALMKLKMKASGDKAIPDSEKIYLQIMLPLGSKDKTKPLFFSKKWSIGRTIDYTANTAGLQNNNNVPGAKKLKLFDPDCGAMYPADVNIESLLGEGENQLFSGSTVILEYVDNNVSLLEDVDLYRS